MVSGSDAKKCTKPRFMDAGCRKPRFIVKIFSNVAESLIKIKIFTAFRVFGCVNQYFFLSRTKRFRISGGKNFGSVEQTFFRLSRNEFVFGYRGTNSVSQFFQYDNADNRRIINFKSIVTELKSPRSSRIKLWIYLTKSPPSFKNC